MGRRRYVTNYSGSWIKCLFWSRPDHAQWDIKLGEDANLKSVNAKFTGKELRVTGRFLDFTVNQKSMADSINSRQATS